MEPGDKRYSPQEAARELSLSKRQVLNLLHSGGLAGEQDERGYWRITHEAVEELRRARQEREPRRASSGQDAGELVGQLRGEVEYLREQLAEEREARRRADHIIAQLGQSNADLAARVSEIEAAPEPEASEGAQDSAVSADEEPDRGTAPASNAEPHTGRLTALWRRLLG